MDDMLQIGGVTMPGFNDLYESILGRSIDDSGLGHWESVWNSGPQDIFAYNDIKNKLVSSDEGQNRVANSTDIFNWQAGDNRFGPSLANNPNAALQVTHNVGNSGNTGMSTWTGPGIGDNGLTVGTENQWMDFQPGYGGAPELPLAQPGSFSQELDNLFGLSRAFGPGGLNPSSASDRDSFFNNFWDARGMDESRFFSRNGARNQFESALDQMADSMSSSPTIPIMAQLASL